LGPGAQAPAAAAFGEQNLSHAWLNCGLVRGHFPFPLLSEVGPVKLRLTCARCRHSQVIDGCAADEAVRCPGCGRRLRVGLRRRPNDNSPDLKTPEIPSSPVCRRRRRAPAPYNQVRLAALALGLTGALVLALMALIAWNGDGTSADPAT